MTIARAAYIQPAPGFIIRHVSFLALDLALKNATLEWLELKRSGTTDVTGNEAICGPRSFLFCEASGELVNTADLVGPLDTAYYHVEIAKRIHDSLGEIDRPMALRFSVVEDMDGGLQFIVLPVEIGGRRMRLLRVAGW